MEKVVWVATDWAPLGNVSVQTADIPCHTGGDRRAISLNAQSVER